MIPTRTRASAILVLVTVVAPIAFAVSMLPTYGAPISQFFASTQPQASATGDFNCDGVMDVVVAKATFASASTFPLNVIIGNGSGGFIDGTASVITGVVPQVQWPREMVVDDFNGDGRPDVFIADTGRDVNPFPGYQNQLLLSTSDCHLVNATSSLPQQPDYTHSATAGDIDNDGDVDLYVGNIYGAAVIPPQIWLNDGTGRFAVASGLLPAAQTDLSQNRYTSSEFVDVNNDGAVDLILGAEDHTTNSVVLLNDGTGHFALVPNAMPAKPFASTAIVLDIKSADINHDGYPDLVLAVTKGVPFYVGRWLQILIGNGQGGFVDQTDTRLPQVDNTKTWFIFVSFADFDGDGNDDLIARVPYQTSSNGSNDHLFATQDSGGQGIFTPVALLAPSALDGVFSLVDRSTNGHRDFLTIGEVITRILPQNNAVILPGIPKDIRLTPLTNRVRLGWPYVWGATSYNIWRSDTPGTQGLLIGTVAATRFEDFAANGTPMYYSVRAVNSAGTSAASKQVTGNLASAPAIATQPSNQVGPSGQTRRFSVSASGTPTPSHRWQKSVNGGVAWTDIVNAAPYSGATTATLTVTNITAGLSGTQYRCIVTSVAGSATSSPATLTIQAAAAPGDLDNDGRTDLTVYRPSNGFWYIRQSSNGFTGYTAYQWGISTDIPVIGDYDGDGRADVAVYRPSTGVWYVLLSSTNYATHSARQWGLDADVPIPGDYDGDGKTDLGIYRPSTGVWYVLLSNTNYATYIARQWGLDADMPVPGDYDGDGKMDLGIYRPSTGVWYVLLSSTNYATYIARQWGLNADVPVPGDYDGDGKTDLGIYRPSTGVWYVLQSGSSFTTYLWRQWGISTDLALGGDYDGDGRTDLAVYRPSTGVWYILQSSTNYTTYIDQHWGLSTDIPVLQPK